MHNGKIRSITVAGHERVWLLGEPQRVYFGRRVRGHQAAQPPALIPFIAKRQRCANRCTVDCIGIAVHGQVAEAEAAAGPRPGVGFERKPSTARHRTEWHGTVRRGEAHSTNGRHTPGKMQCNSAQHTVQRTALWDVDLRWACGAGAAS